MNICIKKPTIWKAGIPALQEESAAAARFSSVAAAGKRAFEMEAASKWLGNIHGITSVKGQPVHRHRSSTNNKESASPSPEREAGRQENRS